MMSALNWLFLRPVRTRFEGASARQAAVRAGSGSESTTSYARSSPAVCLAYSKSRGLHHCCQRLESTQTVVAEWDSAALTICLSGTRDALLDAGQGIIHVGGTDHAVCDRSEPVLAPVADLHTVPVHQPQCIGTG